MDGAEPERLWLDDEQTQEWKALLALTMTLQPALDAQLKRDSGMNSFEYYVLVSLESAPDRMRSMTDLSALTRGSASRLSHAVTRLERSGWVERVACEEAGRRMGAHLTDAGMAKLHDAAPGHVREVRRTVIDALTPQQLATLGDCARAIVHRTAADIGDVLDHQ